MADNRTTVKSNIVTLNVPTVTNAIMTEMLNDNIADSVVFREDVAVTQSSGSTNITVNFTDKDRVDLTRTGGALNITVSGIGDGEIKYLLITKTAGQALTWVGVTDITQVPANVTTLGTVLYEIVRKATNYYCRAWVKTEVQAASETVAGILEVATAAEANALTLNTKIITPSNIPASSLTQHGLATAATATFVDNGNSVNPGGKYLYVGPDQLKRKLEEITAIPSWTALTLGGTWSGNAYYYVDALEIVHVRFFGISNSGSISATPAVTAGTLPSGYRPGTTVFSYPVIFATVAGAGVSAETGMLNIFSTGVVSVVGHPDTITAGRLLYFECSFRKA